MRTFVFPVMFIAFGVLGISRSDAVDPSNLPSELKTAHESLGKMGLTIDRVSQRLIGGRLTAAVPQSAIISEGQKSYVVVLDENDASKSERLEVMLGGRSGDFVQTENAVSPGDYIVVRVEAKPPEKQVVAKAPEKVVPKAPPVVVSPPVVAKRVDPPRLEPIVIDLTPSEPNHDYIVERPSPPEITIPDFTDDRYYRQPVGSIEECEICNSHRDPGPVFTDAELDALYPVYGRNLYDEYGFETGWQHNDYDEPYIDECGPVGYGFEPGYHAPPVRGMDSWDH